ncbi:hypothetical protein J7T55_002329 [Diaporthe amygdali]|uniref:uncharacterized protein n=1 Tax=Phomopsis amygdali TaxID=1214568 RepID=UPI0022FE9346|nr:uncharacterized protein J7T55_002329 [Diaporthe amygdali]KAJ0109137.1 hypothetical protein J7T55_002329 [Diaporthe amygdali]
MPVLTSAGSDSDSSQHSGHLHGDQSLYTRSSLLISAFTAVIAASYLFQKLVLPRFSARRSGHYISRNPYPPRGFASWISSDSKAELIDSWEQARQGQGHFEKQASWTISRGEASGTTPVGLGGSVEGSSVRSMEEEERTTHTEIKGSRGVSNESSYGAEQESSGLPHPDPFFPAAAEESDHVRTSSSFHSLPPLDDVGDEFPGLAETEKDSMDDDLASRQWGYGGVMTTSRSTTPFFGRPYGMADDLGVMYDPDGGFNALSVMGRGQPVQQHLELGPTSQPQSQSMTPTELATGSFHRGRQTYFETRMPFAGYAQSNPAELEAVAIDTPGFDYYQSQIPSYITARTDPSNEDTGSDNRVGSSRLNSPSVGSSRRRGFTKTIPIPADTYGPSSTGPVGAYHSQSTMSNTSFSPSSYPPTSPLLPPPPLTDYPFDPASIMFPGAGAVDGGVRIVYAEHDHDHGHEDSSTYGAHGEAPDEGPDAFNHSSASWTRHTRVYGGGGVCLACAAAGGGGFYGARVRPEDKR